MPEGVEVRLFSDGIKFIENKVILDIEQYHFKKMFSSFNPLELIGYKVNKVFNKGKHIFWELEKDEIKKYIEIQLGMSGGFICSPNKHNMMKFVFDNFNLYYNDIRRFGHWNFHDVNSFHKKYNSMGSDILDMSVEEIKQLSENINKKYLKKPIKEVLMNQNFIGGIGNIYATEALFKSKILPYKQTDQISSECIFDILKNAQDTMKLSYKLQGMSIHSFKNVDGEIGEATNILELYGHYNCSVCYTPLTRTSIAGRTSVYCCNCQK